MTANRDSLVSKLEPYRENPGIKAALLISRDGFLVASSAETGINVEAIAAQVAAVVDIGRRLADELAQAETRYVSIELSGLNLILTPFADDLLLVLVGSPGAIELSYTMRGARPS